MARAQEERYPSVDEFANELRRVLGVPGPDAGAAAGSVLWPISGIDAVSNQLLEAAQALDAGGVLRLEGPEGSGRSALIRRLAWWFGVLGRPVAWIDDATSLATVKGELSAHASLSDAFVLIDSTGRGLFSGASSLSQESAGGRRLDVRSAGSWARSVFATLRGAACRRPVIAVLSISGKGEAGSFHITCAIFLLLRLARGVPRRISKVILPTKGPLLVERADPSSRDHPALVTICHARRKRWARGAAPLDCGANRSGL